MSFSHTLKHNLRLRFNLRIRDNINGPNTSAIRRFHCSNYQQTMQAHLPSSNIRIKGTLLGVLQGSTEKISHSKSSCPIDRARTGLSLDTLHILGKSSWTAAEAYLAVQWWPRLLRCISAMPCPSSMVLFATRWPFPAAAELSIHVAILRMHTA